MFDRLTTDYLQTHRKRARQEEEEEEEEEEEDAHQLGDLGHQMPCRILHILRPPVPVCTHIYLTVARDRFLR